MNEDFVFKKPAPPKDSKSSQDFAFKTKIPKPTSLPRRNSISLVKSDGSPPKLVTDVPKTEITLEASNSSEISREDINQKCRSSPIGPLRRKSLIIEKISYDDIVLKSSQPVKPVFNYITIHPIPNTEIPPKSSVNWNEKCNFPGIEKFEFTKTPNIPIIHRRNTVSSRLDVANLKENMFNSPKTPTEMMILKNSQLPILKRKNNNSHGSFKIPKPSPPNVNKTPNIPKKCITKRRNTLFNELSSKKASIISVNLDSPKTNTNIPNQEKLSKKSIPSKLRAIAPKIENTMNVSSIPIRRNTICTRTDSETSIFTKISSVLKSGDSSTIQYKKNYTFSKTEAENIRASFLNRSTVVFDPIASFPSKPMPYVPKAPQHQLKKRRNTICPKTITSCLPSTCARTNPIQYIRKRGTIQIKSSSGTLETTLPTGKIEIAPKKKHASTPIVKGRNTLCLQDNVEIPKKVQTEGTFDKPTKPKVIITEVITLTPLNMVSVLTETEKTEFSENIPTSMIFNPSINKCEVQKLEIPTSPSVASNVQPHLGECSKPCPVKLETDKPSTSNEVLMSAKYHEKATKAYAEIPTTENEPSHINTPSIDSTNVIHNSEENVTEETKIDVPKKPLQLDKVSSTTTNNALNIPFNSNESILKEESQNNVFQLQTYSPTSSQAILTDNPEEFKENQYYSGLLEIMENSIQGSNVFHDLPIYKRNLLKSHKKTDPLYYCTGCHYIGSAVDFICPTLCSIHCLRKVIKIDPSKMLITEVPNFPKTTVILNSNSSKIFNWGEYLEVTKSQAAPFQFFTHAFPFGPNRFQVGMKLEAIDPQNQSMFCVCTVVQVLGYRIKLNFDSYESTHDFWVNADSMNIFPPGWCARNNRFLNPPIIYQKSRFFWKPYIEKTQGILAHESLFPHLSASYGPNSFKIGMKLESLDKNQDKLCVASVADVLNNRILVHLDGHSQSDDFWVEIDSPYIHPINFHKRVGKKIISPPGWNTAFFWSNYLIHTSSEAAKPSFFGKRTPVKFAEGMKLEVVDLKNPILIRPATVLDVKNFKIKVRFDGWLPAYSFWLDEDSPDIHPIGWAENTGHPLEPPISHSQLPALKPCEILGCRGVGNALKPNTEYHEVSKECPYFSKNWSVKHVFNRIPEKNPNPEVQICRKRKISEDRKFLYDENHSIEECIAVARQFLCNYGPRLKHNYEVACDLRGYSLHPQNTPHQSPLNWGVHETYDYLAGFPSLIKLAKLLRDEEIDGQALLSMRKSDFTDLIKVSSETAETVYSVIVKLRCLVFKKFRSTLFM
ncbi:L3MBTL3.2 family protein [Megaselia abdita]